MGKISLMERLKIASVVALAFGLIAGYGIYRTLSDQRLPEGVSCYTGKFPGLKPYNP